MVVVSSAGTRPKTRAEVDHSPNPNSSSFFLLNKKPLNAHKPLHENILNKTDSNYFKNSLSNSMTNMNDTIIIDTLNNKPLIEKPLNDKPIFYDPLYHELSPIQTNPPPTSTNPLLLSPTKINRDLFPEQTENKKQHN